MYDSVYWHHSLKWNLNFLVFFRDAAAEEEVEVTDCEILRMIPNLITYGAPLAEAIPNPVLSAIMSSYHFALVNIAVIIKNFDANEVRISNIAGTMSKGT